MSRDLIADPISSTSLGGTHRATVDFRRALNAIRKRETRPCFQTLASVASCVRPTFAARSLTLTPVGSVNRQCAPVRYSLWVSLVAGKAPSVSLHAGHMTGGRGHDCMSLVIVRARALALQ